MSDKKNVIAGVLLTGGVIGGIIYLHRMKRTQLNMEVQVVGNVHKVDLDGIIIRVDLLLKNPTKGAFTAKFPFVKLEYKGATIGSSQVVNRDVSVPEYSQVLISEIMIHIPLINAFSVVSSLIKALQKKEKVTIKAIIKSTLIAGPVNIPFEHAYDIAL